MRMWAPADNQDNWDFPIVQQLLGKASESRSSLGASSQVRPFDGTQGAVRPEVMIVFNLSTNYLHAVEFWDSNAPIAQKVDRMSQLLVNAMQSSLIGARERPTRPRKIGFADKE